MSYDKGLLRGIVTTNQDNIEVSRTHYEYDAVDNLSTLTTVVNDQGNALGYTQSHAYSYALWDNYQQELDSASLESNGNRTTGNSWRIYDVNGQLKEAIDSQVDGRGQNNSTKYFTSSLDGIRARLDKDGQTSYLTVAGKTIGDLRLDGNGVQHLEVYSGFTPTGTPEQANPQGGSWQQSKGVPASGIAGFMSQSVTNAEATLPTVPQDNLGAYTLQSGDTLESIALKSTATPVYGTSLPMPTASPSAMEKLVKKEVNCIQVNA